MRILVVDPYPDAGETLCDLLEQYGHEVCCVHTAAEALSLATAFRPDLVVSELVIPGMSGFDLCRALRAQLQHPVHFACYTGLVQEQFTQQAAAAGFDAVFAKPDIRPLLAMVAAQA